MAWSMAVGSCTGEIQLDNCGPENGAAIFLALFSHTIAVHKSGSYEQNSATLLP